MVTLNQNYMSICKKEIEQGVEMDFVWAKTVPEMHSLIQSYFCGHRFSMGKIFGMLKILKKIKNVEKCKENQDFVNLNM